MVDAFEPAGFYGEDEPEGDGKPQATDDAKRTQSQQLIDIAKERYELGVDQHHEPIAIPKNDAPRIAMRFKGSEGFRSSLARAHHEKHGRPPSTNALADALRVLVAEADLAEPEDVHLRVAYEGERVVYDLGDVVGRCVLVNRDGWRTEQSPAATFRRTRVMEAMPVPVEGGEIEDLLSVLNVDTATLDLLIGYLVAGLMSDIPRPILMFHGEQGVGKSTAARILIGLIDPSAVPLRTAPRDQESWALSASSSYALCIDNLSTIPAWLSDALCRAATGDGWVARARYSDAELNVYAFRRLIAMTTIAPEALRGDLGDRLLMVELAPISDDDRLREADVLREFEEIRARLFGALLDVTAATLRELPGINLDRSPRMADFARVVAAVDEVRETTALQTYLGQRKRIAETVVEADPVASYIFKLASRGGWQGFARDLHQSVNAVGEDRPADWPRTVPALGVAVKRCQPALRQLGVEMSVRPKAAGSYYEIRAVIEP